MNRIRNCFFENPHGQSFHYCLYSPLEYESMKALPLVVFLHGWGEKGPEDGSRLDLVCKHGYLKYAAKRDYPFLIAAPQCPLEHVWWQYLESLNAWLDEVLEKTGADPGRITLTGLSMGGYGSWTWAQCFPERFCALVPLCGGGIPVGSDSLVKLPIRAYHGDSDPAVPPSESLKMVSLINSRGGHAVLTLYPGCGHNCWEQAYQDEELIGWIMKQEKE